MKIFVQVLSAVLGTLLLVAVAVNFSNVAGRYLFGKPIFWAEEAMVFLHVWIVVFGAALVSYNNAHLRMDAAEHLLPRWLKSRLDVVTSLLTVLVAVVVAWMSLRIVGGMLENDQRSMAMELPLAIPYSAFPAGFALIAFFTVVRLVHRARGREIAAAAGDELPKSGS